MPGYTGKEITATDRFRAAMKMIDSDGKEFNAEKFVRDLKSTYGYGVSTLCLIYNATGGTLTHVCNKNWEGHIGESPCPSKIENGQWGLFLHVHDTGSGTGSVAATVYRGENADGAVCEWVLAWYNTWKKWWPHGAASERTQSWLNVYTNPWAKWPWGNRVRTRFF